MIEHRYFGKLDPENESSLGVMWNQEVHGINVDMWVDDDYSNLKEEVLNHFEDFLNQFPANLEKYRQYLIEDLAKDDTYIQEHIENLPEKNFPENPVEFVNQMVITNIGLWIETKMIVVDFMADPIDSDEILCLKFNDLGELLEIAWES